MVFEKFRKKCLFSKKVVPLPPKTSNYRSLNAALDFLKQLIVNILTNYLHLEMKNVLFLRLISTTKKRELCQKF